MVFKGWIFKQKSDKPPKRLFDSLLKLFSELLTYSNGDVGKAISWLTEIDSYNNITLEDYGIGDFVKELYDKGFIKKMPDEKGEKSIRPTSKMEITIRKTAFEYIFNNLNSGKGGNHKTKNSGKGDEFTSDLKPFEFGDKLEHINFVESFKNAQINHGIDSFAMSDKDLEVKETYHQTNMATVLMIDISHSMILYGEDRITPAKKVAMALSEFIISRFPKDKLDIIVFGNDAARIEIKDLPYLTVGPYHTNTVAGLEMAIDILRKQKTSNKQIFMITDGKPSCIKTGKKYYKNSFGLDKKIVNRTISLGVKCKKLGIPITTFMIAKDPYLQQFVDMFTEANQGKAYFSGLDGLGDFIFKDYKENKIKRK